MKPPETAPLATDPHDAYIASLYYCAKLLAEELRAKRATGWSPNPSPALALWEEIQQSDQ